MTLQAFVVPFDAVCGYVISSLIIVLAVPHVGESHIDGVSCLINDWDLSIGNVLESVISFFSIGRNILLLSFKK